MLNRSVFLAVSKKVFKQSAIAKSSALPPFFSGGGGSNTAGADKSSSTSYGIVSTPTAAVNIPSSVHTSALLSNPTTSTIHSPPVTPKPAVGRLTKFFGVRRASSATTVKKSSPFSLRKALSLRKVKKVSPKTPVSKHPAKKTTPMKAKPSKKVVKPAKASSKIKKMVKKISKGKQTVGKKKTISRKKSGKK